MATPVPTQRSTMPAAAPQPSAAPQHAAAQLFANSTVAAMKPLFDEQQQNILNELAALRVNVASILARLSERDTGSKRLPRSSKVTGAVGVPGAPTGAVGEEPTKLPTNVMFFCRYMWEKDDCFRERYRTSHVDAILKLPKLLAMPEGTKRRQSEGMLVWKEGLTDAQKISMRDEFARWKTQQTVNGIPNPLEMEKGGDPAPLRDQDFEYQDEVA